MRPSLVAALVLVGCAPALEDRTATVSDPRLLAVRAEPAEAEEGDPVTLTGLYADSSGALESADLDWSFCSTSKPLAELGPVAQTCLDPGSPDLLAIGSGLSVDATLPDDACSLFGPNPPTGADGQTGGRPTDPDITGGYYQPALAFDADDTATLAPVRVRCGLANVSQETYIAWNSGYHNNQHPEIAALDLGADTVSPGETRTLSVAWPECPETGVCGDGICSVDEDQTSCPEDCNDPVGCGGAESYLVYDAATGALSTRREAISATWFGTGGTFDAARNGRGSDETDTSVTNGWTAPETAGEVWIGVVLRDERGGVDFAGGWVTVGG